jgi:hypothetical protein
VVVAVLPEVYARAFTVHVHIEYPLLRTLTLPFVAVGVSAGSHMTSRHV